MSKCLVKTSSPGSRTAYLQMKDLAKHWLCIKTLPLLGWNSALEPGLHRPGSGCFKGFSTQTTKKNTIVLQNIHNRGSEAVASIFL